MHTFEYDDFQKRSMDCIDQNHSLVISAPTGAGKTVIAEYAIEQSMKESLGAIYTSPIKALSNQKYRDFCKSYGSSNVGIVTGDISLNPSAPILVMTTEIFRNALFDNHARFNSQKWAIFDEIHYIDDIERGTVWEESLMFFPEHMRMLCLSATIPNLDEFVQWLKSIHSHSIDRVVETHRPVPLSTYFQCGPYIGPSWKKLKKAHHEFFHRLQKNNNKELQTRNILDKVVKDNHLPLIYFVFARKLTEALAQQCYHLKLVNSSEKEALKNLFFDLVEKYEVSNEPSVKKLEPFVLNGIAYHHAGMLPSLKEIVEQLFASRLIKMIFTTETFALGINMPAKAVVFDDLRKFYGIGFDDLRTRDYYQIAGRAGRRGLDKEGHVYARVNPRRIRYASIQKIINGNYEPIKSQFNSSYATLLHLYDKFGEKLYDIYVSSFHCYQSNKKRQKNAQRDLRNKVAILEKLGHIEKKRLTVKGKFSSQMYGYELMLGELFSKNILEDLDEVSLNMILSALIYEPRKRDISPPLKASFKESHKLIRKLNRYVLREEQRKEISPLTRQGYFHLAEAIEAWSNGSTFLDLETKTPIEEGEVVRNFRMVIQLLRLLKNSPYVSPQFVKKCQKSLKLINRGEVNAERQLRTQ
ncbi:hypothetical protein AB834_05750 [PVC group bacterium (ex Bugula neritina AB1)]|nr:hypothetical protein AB834_05750 [PVC group bacterium (ex Bugula neritina AB1)]